MAKVRQNVVVDGSSGCLGGQLVLKRDKAGRTILSRKPVFDDHRLFTPAQRAQQLAFRQAVAYAAGAHTNPLYIRLAVGTVRTPRNVAISDWLHPPRILQIDLDGWSGQPGGLIRVEAIDDVLVTQVTLSIITSSGALLEHGPALRVDDLWWHYTTIAGASGSLSVLAAAQDLPGHVTQLTRVITP